MQAAHVHLDALLRRARRHGRRVLLLSAPPRRRRRALPPGVRLPETGPGPGRQAAADLGLDSAGPSSSATSGSTSGLAVNAGARGILVRTGYGGHDVPAAPPGSTALRPSTRCSMRPDGFSPMRRPCGRPIAPAGRLNRWRTTLRHLLSIPRGSLASSSVPVASRRRHRRPHGRRVHLRPGRTRLARSARADPAVRHDDRRAGRGRQRRRQRRRARRARDASRASWAATRRGAGCSPHSTRG